MSEICKCPGENCPLKEKCYRFTRAPDLYQNYLIKVPYNTETQKCDLFLQLPKNTGNIA